MTQRSIGILLVIVSLLCASSAFAGRRETVSMQRSGDAVVGQRAPWFAAWTMDEQVFNLKKPFADPNVQRLALVFFAKRCEPCKEGIRKLAQAKAQLEAAGVYVVLINFEDRAGDVRKFFNDQLPPFPVVVDSGEVSAKLYVMDGDGSGSIPRTILIDRSQTVMTIFGSEGEDYIERLINGQ